MTELEQKDPETFKALADGGFIVQLKDVSGVALYVIQNLEQKIKKIEAAGDLLACLKMLAVETAC